MLVRGLLGDAVTTVSNQELINAGISAEPTVYLLPVYVPDFCSKGKKGAPYEVVYDQAIVFNNYRNELIAKSAKHFLDKGKSVFTIVWRIDHGHEVERWMRQYGIECEFISGEGSTAQRNQQVLKSFKEKKLKCVISSLISDEGLDIPAMDILIIAPGDRSPLKVIQRVGRGLRKKVGVPNVVTIVDFVDFTHRHLLNHARDRCTVYVKEKIKIYEVLTPDWTQIEKRIEG
jgi:superfamily II DNA or RNA helicase